MYSITCLDGIWSAHYIRAGEEFGDRSLPELRTKGSPGLPAQA
jgi:hypothetical protein